MIHFPQSGHTTILAPPVPPATCPPSSGAAASSFQSRPMSCRRRCQRRCQAARRDPHARGAHRPELQRRPGDGLAAGCQQSHRPEGRARYAAALAAKYAGHRRSRERPRTAATGRSRSRRGVGKPPLAGRSGYRVARGRSAGGGGVPAEGRGNRSAANAITRAPATAARVFRRWSRIFSGGARTQRARRR